MSKFKDTYLNVLEHTKILIQPLEEGSAGVEYGDVAD